MAADLRAPRGGHFQATGFLILPLHKTWPAFSHVRVAFREVFPRPIVDASQLSMFAI
jgi:hypothetical protein